MVSLPCPVPLVSSQWWPVPPAAWEILMVTVIHQPECRYMAWQLGRDNCAECDFKEISSPLSDSKYSLSTASFTMKLFIPRESLLFC